MKNNGLGWRKPVGVEQEHSQKNQQLADNASAESAENATNVPTGYVMGTCVAVGLLVRFTVIGGTFAYAVPEYTAGDLVAWFALATCVSLVLEMFLFSALAGKA